jgi:hypothetical protein
MDAAVANMGDAWGKIFPVEQRVLNARSVLQARQAELDTKRALWRKRVLIGQAVVTAYFFVRWSISNGGIFWAMIGAAIVWCLLLAAHLIVPLMIGTESSAAETARRDLATVTQHSIEQFLASSALGPYRWIRRQDRVLGVFSEAGCLYYFGKSSGYQHLLLRISHAIQQVTVTNRSTVQESSVSTTTHGRRNVYGVTNNFSVIGGGKSETSTTTTSTVHHAYTLEVQFLMNANDQPYWLTLPFGADRQEAENWRLMIARASKPVA